jgi:hypothetical protein
MPSVKGITAAPPLLVFEWPKDQESGVQCVVEALNDLGWRAVVQDLGTRTQVVWNGPSVLGIPRPVAVFDVLPASGANPSRIEMRVADDPSEPDRIRQSWKAKLASCR